MLQRSPSPSVLNFSALLFCNTKNPVTYSCTIHSFIHRKTRIPYSFFPSNKEYFVSHPSFKRWLWKKTAVLLLCYIVFHPLAFKILYKEDENNFPSHSNKEPGRKSDLFRYGLSVNWWSGKVVLLSPELESYPCSDADQCSKCFSLPETQKHMAK